MTRGSCSILRRWLLLPLPWLLLAILAAGSPAQGPSAEPGGPGGPSGPSGPSGPGGPDGPFGPGSDLLSRARAAWSALGGGGGTSRRSLAEWARLDSARWIAERELAAALGRSPLPAWPGEADLAWARRWVLEGWLQGEPAATALLSDAWEPEQTAAWNADGALTLPAAVILAARGDGPRARAWLRRGPLPPADREWGDALALELALAAGDTAGAGELARARLSAGGTLSSWLRVACEDAAIQAALAAGELAAARAGIDGYSARIDERGRWLLHRRRLAALAGRAAEAESLTWVVLREYPSGGMSRRVLAALVPGGAGPAAELDPSRLRLLLAAAERQGDLERFRACEAALLSRLEAPGRDSLAIRGGRLAWKARQYELLLRRHDEGAWRPAARFGVEWNLLLARALRNTGRADSMAARYAWVARHGRGEDRVTAFWEWAREQEHLRDFAAADSLYAEAIQAGAGDLRDQARLRRGVCRFGLGDWEGARSRFERALSDAGENDRACAWFWIYRTELARGRPDSASAALRRAARGRAGYYGRRADRALRLAGSPGGVPLDDPAGFWQALTAEGAAPGLEAAWARSEPASGERATAGPGLASEAAAQHLRDRLLLFRLAGRTEWARMVREELEEALAASGGGRAAWSALGFPDLAARAAVRGGGTLAERYPTPYLAPVASAARRFALAPEWIWAIMRRESFFESAVVSGAGATGLLQLMEPTARATARHHGLESAPLGAPAVNLLLGAAHLHDLRVEAGGSWPVILAAYNAGLSPAGRWLREGEDPDFYIEMIGYRETRDYVRHVLEGYWIYREALRPEPAAPAAGG